MISTDRSLVLRRSYAASPERIWTLWTTAAGIGAWWSPEGFSTCVDVLELRPGGALVHTMTAVRPEQIAFLDAAGLPRSTTARKEFTVVEEPTRLAYTSLIDFVPDVAPYQHLTVVTLERTRAGTDVVMEIDAMHDDVWTDRLLAGRAEELDNLVRLVGNATLCGELRRY